MAFALTTALVSVNAGAAFAAPISIGSDTVTNVNTAIVAGETAPDVTVNVAGTAVITGPGAVVVAPVDVGEGDGAIVFNNLGHLGAVGVLGVTDNVGLQLIGAGSAATGNTATVTNAGLITGGIQVSGFGGDISITNGGTVYNGIFGSGYGDVNIATSAGGSVVGGGPLVVDAYAQQTLAGSVVSNGVTTTTYTGGNAQVDQNGNALQADGVTRASVGARSDAGNATVNVGAKADMALAVGGYYSSSTVTASQAPVLNATTTTSENDSIAGLGGAAVNINAGGDVNGVVADGGAGGATVTVAGKVGTNGISAESNRTSYFNKQTVTQDGTGITSTTDSHSNVRAGGVASVTVASTGSVAGGISAIGDAGANVTANGNVGDGITASQQTGNDYAESHTYTVADQTTVDTYANTYAAGDATIAVGRGVTIGGGLEAFANGTASVSTGASSIVNGDVYVDAQPGTNTTYTYTNVPGAVAGDYTNTDARTYDTAGGAANFSNQGYVAGDVNVYGVTGATVTNAGQVTGSTYVSTGGSNTDYTTVDSQVTTTAGGVTTVTASSTETSKTTGIAGDITGTYSGTNGQVTFSPQSLGTITQEASGNSTVTASGNIYGSIYSTAGNGYATDQSDSVETTVTTIDGTTPANNTQTYAYNETGSTTSGAGTSTVNVSGSVTGGNYFGSQDVESNGTTGSVVNVSGLVDGSVTSNASGITVAQYSDTTNRTWVGASLNTLTQESVQDTDSSTVTGGAASASVTGTGVIDGSLEVNGVSSATAQVGAAAAVNDGLYVVAGGTDTSHTNSNPNSYIYSYDPVANTSTRVEKTSSTEVAAAGSGNASANVDGYVGRGVRVEAYRGNANASIQGHVDGRVDVVADHTGFASSSEHDYAGSGASPSITQDIYIDTYTHTGGVATVLIDTSATQQAQNVGSTIPSVGDVNASGVGGASVTVTAGSRVGGDVYADSVFNNGTSTHTITYNAAGNSGTEAYTGAYTAVGGAASVVNNGTIDGWAEASGLTTASVTNSGTAEGLGAYAYGYDWTYSSVDNDWDNLSPSTRTIVRTEVDTPVLGAATVTNSGTTNEVDLFAGTGTLTNSGTIDGNVYLGESVYNGTYTQTITSTTAEYPDWVFTPAATLASQTYTVNQNGTLTGNVYVDGADITDPAGNLVKTSNVNATINLNAGSTTTGSFFSANDTVTTVNVNGGELFLSGPAYVPASATNGVASWSAGLDGAATAGSFQLNVNSGIAQIVPPSAPSPVSSLSAAASSTPAIFGINGSVNVGPNGTLVIGLLNTPTNSGSGSSITATSPTVTGANLLVSGDFATSGTLAIGMNGTLVKTAFAPVSTSADFLAPITTILAGEGTAYTTPAASGLAVNSPSSITVNGNLTLGGKIQVYVPTGSIFLGNESTPLFTVGGTITGTATVASNLTSQFVTLSAATSGHTVTVKATRNSYATAATSPNAAAAAVALDKAIPGVVKVLVDDASGIRSYSSLDQLNKIQDVANVVSNLDWNLTKAQAAEVFNELASASIYGSLANLHQNVAFEGQFDNLVSQQREGREASVGLWLTPVGNFAKFGGTSSGASKIDATSYGGAVGIDVAYGSNGAFGFGFGYARHNVDTKSFPSSADADTYSLGAYWTQGFGPLAVNAKVVYGFSTFDTYRDLALLSRTATGHFRGKELDASLGVNYTFNYGGMDVVPFGELSLRHWSMNGFTEQGAAGLGLTVDGASKTVFDPTVGVRLTTAIKASDSFTLKPYASLAYTFQGNAGTERTVGYLGDPAGNTFVLNGVNPKGYAALSGGLNTQVADKVNISVGGSYAFGGHNNVAAINGLVAIKF